MKLKDRVAVLSGAGSGIGRATAMALARRGCHLALVDVDPIGLEQTAAQAGKLGVCISQHQLDVTSHEGVRSLPAAVSGGLHDRVDLLVNNAGVALGGTFSQVSEADFDWLMEVNFHSMVRMTRAFLPLLQASDEARIVNLSSLYGLISPPGQCAYSASKFAVRGFSNALRHELVNTRVGVTVVHPGGVATAIARNARISAGLTPEQVRERVARAETHLRMPPDKAAEIIVRAIEQRRHRVLVGADAKLISVLERLVPVSYWRVLGRLMPP
jgi:NAD(P)-dependent dehydrogenase (short-subunit alcohol dehydrogenase family)